MELIGSSIKLFRNILEFMESKLEIVEFISNEVELIKEEVKSARTKWNKVKELGKEADFTGKKWNLLEFK